MGQAKRRGTFEERKAQAIEHRKNAIVIPPHRAAKLSDNDLLKLTMLAALCTTTS